MDDNEKRELLKVQDILIRIVGYLDSKDNMNAALHMALTVRPTPLATAAEGALATIAGLL